LLLNGHNLAEIEVGDSLPEKVYVISEAAKPVVAAVAQQAAHFASGVVMVNMQVVGFRVPGYRWFLANSTHPTLLLKPGRVLRFNDAVKSLSDSVAARFAIIGIGVPAGRFGLVAGDATVIAPVVGNKSREWLLVLAGRTKFLVKRAGRRLATGFQMALELADRQFGLAVAAGN
jgi:hypothetical protein